MQQHSIESQTATGWRRTVPMERQHDRDGDRSQHSASKVGRFHSPAVLPFGRDTVASHHHSAWTMFESRRRRQLLSSVAMLILVVILLTPFATCVVRCAETAPPSNTASDSVEARSIDSGSDQDDSLVNRLINAEPRQYFKLHVGPFSGVSSKRLLSKRHQPGGTRSSNAAANSTAAAGASANSAADSNSNNNKLGDKYLSSKQKISNAMLKKLLNQSLLSRPSNGSQPATSGGSGATAGAGSKAPNFKFVFIQRATAAPQSVASTSTAAPSAVSADDRASAAAGVDNMSSGGGGGSSSNKSPVQPQQSLAASVSKQLASSLLNSAASLVANLNVSSAPSLTSLASQIVAQTLDHSANSIPSGVKKGSQPVLSSSDDLSTGGTEQRETQQQQQETKKARTGAITSDYSSSSGSKKRPSTGGSSSSGATKKGPLTRPSKIYNLPVKFVANGQPNHVVFSTIRQHFATIKKLQAAAKTVATAASQQQSATKRRKQPSSSSGQKKLKGNSRLIYLPLKYFSNARPSKLISYKATHKSNAGQ